MTTSLVIGGNGFLGSHVVDLLVSLGHEVTVFDRFSRGGQTYASEGVRRVAGDFLDEATLSSAMRGQDNVFHFLSFTTPATAQANPSLDVQNLAGSVRMMEIASDQSVKRIYYASTGGAIYSPGSLASFPETHPTSPVSPYGIVKLAIEHYLGFFRETRGLESTVLRISNPYGPRQRADRPQGLIATALSHVASDRPVVRYGDGSMVRDYLYVDDMIRMIKKVVLDGGSNVVYNIGNGRGHTVNEVLECIERVTGLKVQVRNVAAPASFVERSVLDIGRYVNDFGAPDLTTLDEGMFRTWEHFRAHPRSVAASGQRPEPETSHRVAATDAEFAADNVQ